VRRPILRLGLCSGQGRLYIFVQISFFCEGGGLLVALCFSREGVCL